MKYTLITLSILIITSCKQPSSKSVLLQPYDGIDDKIVDSVKQSVEKTFGFKVYVAPKIKIPESAFVNIKSPRYRADTIIRFQVRQKPDSIDFVLGLTHQPISTTKRDAKGNILKPLKRYTDWGILGLGYCPGSSCIVSTYYMKASNRNLVLERLKKVCNHELGHNLGLPHCTNDTTCVLRDAAETVRTVDKVGFTLCKACRKRLGIVN